MNPKNFTVYQKFPHCFTRELKKINQKKINYLNYKSERIMYKGLSIYTRKYVPCPFRFRIHTVRPFSINTILYIIIK